ncbi:MAG: HupE/UreJ family protein [Actinobacteria bacterium]|nr:HupE/UreJ family protein [Actinomycetota bacterium]
MSSENLERRCSVATDAVDPEAAAVSGSRIAILAAAVVVAAVLDALPAAAHTGQGTGAVWSGLLHPLLGPDHVFAMVAVGVLAAVIHRPFAVPGAFVAAMVLGGALGMAGMPLPGGELAIALSVVALGAALVAGTLTRPELALALVAVAGFVHGHAHGTEAPYAAEPIAYVAGFVVATATLHAAGVGVGQVVSRRPAVRAALGSIVIGAGVAFAVGIA